MTKIIEKSILIGDIIHRLNDMQKSALTLVLFLSLLYFTPIVFGFKTSVEERIVNEDKLEANPFGIRFHKPNYILPYYYTGSPDNAVYVNATPNNEKIDRAEFKYQISLKVPLWKNIYNQYHNLYLAYTQLSYWQVYNNTAFFRETDYEPEIFLANQLRSFILGTKLDLVNIGLVHQSNGFGNHLERSWNRAYFDFVFSMRNWMFSIKPWYIFNDATMESHNPDIATYLGHGQIIIAYKLPDYDQEISLLVHNLIESGAKRFGAELSYSFPLTKHIKGFVQGVSGYGQSLIEYNHRTNSLGIGIALSNWV